MARPKKTETKSKFIPELATTKEKNKTNQYVNNAEFLAEIIKYRALCKTAKAKNKPKPKIPDIIGKQLLLIAKNLSHKPNFNNYPSKEEMIGDGIENCIMYFDNFDPKKSKYPFTYFTKIIYYAFVRRIQKEKKQLYVRYKMTQQSNSLNNQELQENEELNPGSNAELYENISDFIGKYEEAQAASKKKNSTKKVKLELLIDD